MKLLSVLRAMDENDRVSVVDENAPISNMTLFEGTVKDCMKQGYFRNGIVCSLVACNDTILIGLDIEYQKRKAVRCDGKL